MDNNSYWNQKQQEQNGNFSQQAGPVQNPYQPRQNGESGFAIAGMVCGILSILCCSWMIFDFLLAIPGIIFSIVVLVKNYAGKGMAVAGLICSTVGLFLSLVFLAILVMV